MPVEDYVCNDTAVVTLKSCEYCGTDFTPRRTTGRFCKPACRRAAHYARTVIPVGARAAYRAARRGARAIPFDPRFSGPPVGAGLTRPPGYAARRSQFLLAKPEEEKC